MSREELRIQVTAGVTPDTLVGEVMLRLDPAHLPDAGVPLTPRHARELGKALVVAAAEAEKGARRARRDRGM